MHIPRLNIRQTFAQVGTRSKLSTLDSHVVPDKIHTNYQAPRSNVGVTQPSMELDTYPSRHAYGYTNMDDFTRERGQRGFSDLRQGMSERNAETWSMIENGARPHHNEIAAQAKQNLNKLMTPPKEHVVAQAIPDPQMTVHPCETKGEVDPGKYEAKFDPHEAFADVKFNQGSFEVYMKQKNDINQWITQDTYDIYA